MFRILNKKCVMIIVCNYIPYTACVGCPKGWICCARKWGACICRRPGWDSCCVRITSPTCLAKNAACWVLKKPLDLALQLAIVVVDKSRHALDVVKAALSVAQGVVYSARVTLDGAKAFLGGVKKPIKLVSVHCLTLR